MYVFCTVKEIPLPKKQKTKLQMSKIKMLRFLLGVTKLNKFCRKKLKKTRLESMDMRIKIVKIDY